MVAVNEIRVDDHEEDLGILERCWKEPIQKMVTAVMLGKECRVKNIGSLYGW